MDGALPDAEQRAHAERLHLVDARTSTVQPSSTRSRASSAIFSGYRSLAERLASVRPHSTPSAMAIGRFNHLVGAPSPIRTSSSTLRSMAGVSRTRP